METTNYVECLCFELCLDSEIIPWVFGFPVNQQAAPLLPFRTAFPWMKA